MTIEQELAQTKELLTKAEQERDSAREQAQKNFKAFQEASNVAMEAKETAEKLGKENAESKATNEKLSKERDEAAKKAKDAEDGVGPKAQALLEAALAKHGQPSLNLGAEGGAGNAEMKSDVSKLTGLAKAIAAHTAECAAKSATK